MAFKGDTVKLQDAVSMTATRQSSAADVGQYTHWSMTFVWTDSPVGICTIETSPNLIDWMTINGTSQATGGTSGSLTVNYQGAGHRYLRAVYTYTSGSGSLTAYLTAK